jgi:hypothetical protein
MVPGHDPRGAAGVQATDFDENWRLSSIGERAVSLSLAESQPLLQEIYDPLIACVHGRSAT